MQVALALAYMGQCYMNTRKVKRGLNLCFQAVEMRKRLHRTADDLKHAELLYNIAEGLNKQKNYTRAFDFHKKWIEMRERLFDKCADNSDLPSMAHFAALNYYSNKYYSLALELLLKADELKSKETPINASDEKNESIHLDYDDDDSDCECYENRDC
jgi:tetratricopeptide (TPR) repeat protein